MVDYAIPWTPMVEMEPGQVDGGAASGVSHFRALFETSAWGMAVLVDGRIGFANAATARLLGAAGAASCVGLALESWFAPGTSQVVASTLAALERGAGEPLRSTIGLRRLDGPAVTVDLHAWSLAGAGVRGAAILLQEVGGAAATLQERLVQAEKMEAVGRLAGGIAHDFNNMLTAISGHAELALNQLEPYDPVYGEVEEVVRAATRAAGMTRQLLAFGRRQVLQPRLVDLNAVIRDIDRLLGRLIGEDVELRLELAPDLPRVIADPAQLEQVLLNLVINARDAMPGGGRVVVATEAVSLPAPENGVPAGEHVRLGVSDTGTGMPPEVLAHVFEPFYSTREQGRGTGLGLSTVYGIVTQSGGQIRAESRPGAGSAFTIWLPAAPPDAPAPPAEPTTVPRSATVPRGGAETILLAEDERSVRDFARRVLERRGFSVLEAANGPEALRLLADHPGTVHLLLSDVVMPGMNGRELAERVAVLRPGIRVLFMSGYTEDDVLRRGIAGFGENFLQKPFAPEDLVAAVRTALDRPRPAGVVS